MSAKVMDLEVGDVVQIKPVGQRFGGCFMVVTEPKAWGAQGYVTVPGEDGLAYYRVATESMKFIGKAEWVEEDA